LQVPEFASETVKNWFQQVAVTYRLQFIAETTGRGKLLHSVTSTCQSFPPKFLRVSGLEHLTELSQDDVGDYNRLTHGRQIRRAKKKATTLNDKRIETCIDKFAAGV